MRMLSDNQIKLTKNNNNIYQFHYHLPYSFSRIPHLIQPRLTIVPHCIGSSEEKNIHLITHPYSLYKWKIYSFVSLGNRFFVKYQFAKKKKGLISRPIPHTALYSNYSLYLSYEKKYISTRTQAGKKNFHRQLNSTPSSSSSASLSPITIDSLQSKGGTHQTHGRQ